MGGTPSFPRRREWGAEGGVVLDRTYNSLETILQDSL